MALLGPRQMSDLSPQSGRKRTLIRADRYIASGGVMKIVKTLLLTAAVLISASAYAGSVKLPKADPLIGHWCLKQEEGVNGAPASIYERMQGSDCGSNVDVDG